MPRQPLSSKREKSVLLDPRALEQRPKAAARIAECIAAWTEVELQFGRLLAKMLQAEAQPAIALYFSLRNERQKTEALETIAEYTLDDAKKTIFDKIMIAKKSLAAQRHDLAHGLFGTSGCTKDGVIWISTKDRVLHERELTQISLIKNKSEWSKKIFEIIKFIYVYELKDLEQLKDDILQMYEIVSNFESLLRASGDGERQLLEWLKTQPLLR